MFDKNEPFKEIFPGVIIYFLSEKKILLKD